MSCFSQRSCTVELWRILKHLKSAKLTLLLLLWTFIFGIHQRTVQWDCKILPKCQSGNKFTLLKPQIIPQTSDSEIQGLWYGAVLLLLASGAVLRDLYPFMVSSLYPLWIGKGVEFLWAQCRVLISPSAEIKPLCLKCKFSRIFDIELKFSGFWKGLSGKYTQLQIQLWVEIVVHQSCCQWVKGLIFIKFTAETR